MWVSGSFTWLFNVNRSNKCNWFKVRRRSGKTGKGSAKGKVEKEQRISCRCKLTKHRPGTVCGVAGKSVSGDVRCVVHHYSFPLSRLTETTWTSSGMVVAQYISDAMYEFLQHQTGLVCGKQWQRSKNIFFFIIYRSMSRYFYYFISKHLFQGL